MCLNLEAFAAYPALKENKTFKIFTLLIAEIISEFEKDRAYIAREMDEYDNILYGPERDREKAEKLKN